MSTYKEINITYYFAYKNDDTAAENNPDICEISVGNRSICLTRKRVFHSIVKNKISALFFSWLFIENKNLEQIKKEIAALYELDNSEEQSVVQDITSFYEQFKNVEYIYGKPLEYD